MHHISIQFLTCLQCWNAERVFLLPILSKKLTAVHSFVTSPSKRSLRPQVPWVFLMLLLLNLVFTESTIFYRNSSHTARRPCASHDLRSSHCTWQTCANPVMRWMDRFIRSHGPWNQNTLWLHAVLGLKRHFGHLGPPASAIWSGSQPPTAEAKALISAEATALALGASRWTSLCCMLHLFWGFGMFLRGYQQAFANSTKYGASLCPFRSILLLSHSLWKKRLISGIDWFTQIADECWWLPVVFHFFQWF